MSLSRLTSAFIASQTLACKEPNDWSELQSLSDDAICSQEPMDDFIITEQTQATLDEIEKTKGAEDLVASFLVEADDFEIYKYNLFTDSVAGLKLLLYPEGNGEDGINNLGYSKENGDAYYESDVEGYVCDDGTAVYGAKFQTLLGTIDALLVADCDFTINPDLTTSGSCNGWLYDNCAYTPDIDLNNVEEGCELMAEFKNATTDLLCFVYETDGSSYYNYCDQYYQEYISAR